jgi:hypothetical protein
MDNTEKLATHRVHNDNEGIYETLNKTCKKLDLPTFLKFLLSGEQGSPHIVKTGRLDFSLS